MIKKIHFFKDKDAKVILLTSKQKFRTDLTQS